MRIGLVGPTDPDSFAENIGHTLSRMDHAVEYLGSSRAERRNRISLRMTEAYRQAFPDAESKVHKKLVQVAIDTRCDVVISTDATLAPEAVTLLRRHKVGVGLWFPDAVSNLGRMRMLAAPYTAFFFKDELLVQRLRDNLNLPAWYLPEACNPFWHRPIGDAGSRGHIVVVGNTYISRLLLLERLYKDGIPIQVYGSPFPRWAPSVLPSSCHTGRIVRREEKSQVFREAAGVLNNLHPAEMTSVNARLFEATAAGAAVLCEERPSLRELYDRDSEVMPFAKYGDLLRGARELLSNQARSEEIGDAASKRAHGDHSYEVRLKVMLEKLA